eukprot:4609216-Pyramimonas_sp.AAC.1
MASRRAGTRCAKCPVEAPTQRARSARRSCCNVTVVDSSRRKQCDRYYLSRQLAGNPEFSFCWRCLKEAVCGHTLAKNCAIVQ